MVCCIATWWCCVAAWLYCVATWLYCVATWWCDRHLPDDRRERRSEDLGGPVRTHHFGGEVGLDGEKVVKGLAVGGAEPVLAENRVEARLKVGLDNGRRRNGGDGIVKKVRMRGEPYSACAKAVEQHALRIRHRGDADEVGDDLFDAEHQAHIQSRGSGRRRGACA